ncbi:hypothetical protein AC579_1443 [Pseudocercospora musae]|uniref:Uncharacterized protein n=1 Tax=Pseudocercospora musae TaxID=113226 RepID=A0A139IMD8_9PEZI|nr:hypothetical protein AC579_1443 [Pseudocercospora musae]
MNILETALDSVGPDARLMASSEKQELSGLFASSSVIDIDEGPVWYDGSLSIELEEACWQVRNADGAERHCLRRHGAANQNAETSNANTVTTWNISDQGKASEPSLEILVDVTALLTAPPSKHMITAPRPVRRLSISALFVVEAFSTQKIYIATNSVFILWSARISALYLVASIMSSVLLGRIIGVGICRGCIGPQCCTTRDDGEMTYEGLE